MHACLQILFLTVPFVTDIGNSNIGFANMACQQKQEKDGMSPYLSP
jgi:hypothetical protein